MMNVWLIHVRQVRTDLMHRDLSPSSSPTTIWPRREKTCLRDVRQSEFQTSLLSFRD